MHLWRTDPWQSAGKTVGGSGAVDEVELRSERLSFAIPGVKSASFVLRQPAPSAVTFAGG